MNDGADRTFRFLPVVTAGLLVVAIVQSILIFAMYRQSAGPWPAPRHDTTSFRQRAREASGPTRSGTSSVPQSADEDQDPPAWNPDRWDPFQEMRSMHDRINRMFGNAFERFQQSDDFGLLSEGYAFAPDVNIEDKGDHFLVTVDAPGVEESKIDVMLNGQTLTVSGSVRSDTTEISKGKMLRKERRSGRFQRTVTLPSPVRGDKMTTATRKGVVFITIPKATE